MSRYDNGIRYCEDCAFYNRPIRPGVCSAPQNLKHKPYENYVTRRHDVYVVRWKNIETMRLPGRWMARLMRACGQEARWFQAASNATVEARINGRK